MLKATVLLLLIMATMNIASVVHADESPILSQPVCNYIKNASGNISGCTAESNGSTETGIENNGGLITQIVNTILFAAGIVALVFVLVGGFRYITSTGDSTRIQGAKDTLLYAIIGLIITIVAVPIADFVIAKVSGS
jgi:type IV secretion system pilin